MRNQRFSRQREEIYGAVRNTQAHPTAEMVYTWLKPVMPRLSLGTVYRNLHQMAQEGRLVELPGPVARFDAITHPHTHFCCVACGAMADLALPYDAGLDREARDEGWEVQQHQLIFYGICPACAGKNRQGQDLSLS